LRSFRQALSPAQVLEDGAPGWGGRVKRAIEPEHGLVVGGRIDGHARAGQEVLGGRFGPVDGEELGMAVEIGTDVLALARLARLGLRSEEGLDATSSTPMPEGMPRKPA
jgi:hypothetical protein